MSAIGEGAIPSRQYHMGDDRGKGRLFEEGTSLRRSALGDNEVTKDVSIQSPERAEHTEPEREGISSLKSPLRLDRTTPPDGPDYTTSTNPITPLRRPSNPSNVDHSHVRSRSTVDLDLLTPQSRLGGDRDDTAIVNVDGESEDLLLEVVHESAANNHTHTPYLKSQACTPPDSPLQGDLKHSLPSPLPPLPTHRQPYLPVSTASRTSSSTTPIDTDVEN